METFIQDESAEVYIERGLTHLSICHAGRIRVYSNAVFAEFMSFERALRQKSTKH